MPGNFCNFQGYVLNTGNVCSSVWAFVISLHTFLLLAGGPRWRGWVAEKSSSGKGRWFFAAGIWGFVLFIGMIGMALIQNVTPEKGPFCMIPHYFTDGR